MARCMSGSSGTSIGWETHSSGCLSLSNCPSVSLSTCPANITVKEVTVIITVSNHHLIWHLLAVLESGWPRSCSREVAPKLRGRNRTRFDQITVCKQAVLCHVSLSKVTEWTYGLTIPLDGRLWVVAAHNPKFTRLGQVSNFLSRFSVEAVECSWLVFPQMLVASWPGDSDDSTYEFTMEGIEGYIMAPDLEQAKWPGEEEVPLEECKMSPVSGDPIAKTRLKRWRQFWDDSDQVAMTWWFLKACPACVRENLVGVVWGVIVKLTQSQLDALVFV